MRQQSCRFAPELVDHYIFSSLIYVLLMVISIQVTVLLCQPVCTKHILVCRLVGFLQMLICPAAESFSTFAERSSQDS